MRRAKCPFLMTITEKSIQCGFNYKDLGNVDFSETYECQSWVDGKCYGGFLNCEYYHKYYDDPQIIYPEDKQCIRCCNNSWYMGLPHGLDGQKYCFCQKDKKPMRHDDFCEWFDRHLDWPLEPTEENGFHLKEGAGMGKMSTANIVDAMKKAKQKTDTLKFAPHPEDLPLMVLQPNPHNKFADQDDTTSIDDIKDNILRVGLINPIAVNRKDGVYYIMSGERRFHAIEAIQKDNPEKFSYVRCTVYENLTFAEEMEVLYAANLKVRHYDAAQRLEYFQQLKDILSEEKAAGRYDGPIQADIAAIMGVTDRQARKYDQINQELDDADKQKIKSGELSVDAAAKKAAERRQERKTGVTGSASDDKPDMAFWEPYIRELILFFKNRQEQILNYYQEQQRSAADGTAFLKSILNNCGGAHDYSNGNGCQYDFGGGKLQLDVEEYSADREKIKKRHREHFSWTQVERIVRQMIIDGSLKGRPYVTYCKDCANCHREASGERNLICEEHGCITTEKDFCSWGAPKENEEA